MTQLPVVYVFKNGIPVRTVDSDKPRFCSAHVPVYSPILHPEGYDITL